MNLMEVKVHREDFINNSIKNSPNYLKRIRTKDAIQRTIRCIHGLRPLHKKFEMNEIEIYIGRTSENKLIQRWKSHFEKKQHTFAAILFVCSHDYVEDLELVAIKILKKLQDQQKLCVKSIKNEKTRKTGGKPRKEERAIVYMTWKYSNGPSENTKPGIELLKEIATETYIETKKEVKIRSIQIQQGLLSLKKINTYDKLEFYI